MYNIINDTATADRDLEEYQVIAPLGQLCHSMTQSESPNCAILQGYIVAINYIHAGQELTIR